MSETIGRMTTQTTTIGVSDAGDVVNDYGGGGGGDMEGFGEN